jgi:hypothetical protein
VSVGEISTDQAEIKTSASMIKTATAASSSRRSCARPSRPTDEKDELCRSARGDELPEAPLRLEGQASAGGSHEPPSQRASGP